VLLRCYLNGIWLWQCRDVLKPATDSGYAASFARARFQSCNCSGLAVLGNMVECVALRRTVLSRPAQLMTSCTKKIFILCFSVGEVWNRDAVDQDMKKEHLMRVSECPREPGEGQAKEDWVDLFNPKHRRCSGLS